MVCQCRPIPVARWRTSFLPALGQWPHQDPKLSVCWIRRTRLHAWAESDTKRTRDGCPGYLLKTDQSAVMYQYSRLGPPVNRIDSIACMFRHGQLQSEAVEVCTVRTTRYLEQISTRMNTVFCSRRSSHFPRTRTVTFGSRAFAVSGLICWNALPPSLKSPSLKPGEFCGLLKTTLMAQSS